MLTLSQINGALPNTNSNEVIFIDDPEVITAISEYQNSRTLKKEYERLEEHAKKIFEEKLLTKNIKRVTTGSKTMKIAPITKDIFDISTFRDQNPNAYNMYLKKIFYNKYTISDEKTISE